MRGNPKILDSFFLFAMVVLVATVACSKQQISERDSRRNQLRNQAELKRKELQLIAGNYSGEVVQASGQTQNAVLSLQVKDIPTQVDGQVDPVITPVLSGFIRFYFGSPDSSEYIGFSVQKAEYDPKRESLDLVTQNANYKQLIIQLVKSTSGVLEGSWTAPDIATSGSAYFEKVEEINIGNELSGTYGGILERPSGDFQFAHLNVNTSFVPPEGLKINATLRVIFGPWDSSEYLTYDFGSVDFNPITGQFVLKNEKNEVSFVGHINRGEISGYWYSIYGGRMGPARFGVATPPQPPNSEKPVTSLKGTYQGRVINSNPKSNLPEKIQFSLVTSQNLNQKSGIQVSGGLRLYLGDFGSLEYVELPFSDVEYNFFTGTLVAKTEGQYRLTLKAQVADGVINGSMNEDSLGEIGDFEASRL